MSKWGKPNTYKPIDLDALKSQCDLRQLIVPHLQKARPISGGEYYQACCPFHEDNKPSFLVFKEYFQCKSASCGEWGSIVDWYAHLYPELEWAELLKRIEDEQAHPIAIPYPKTKIRISQEEPLPELMNPAILNDCTIIPERGWVRYPDAKKWVWDQWRLNDETIYQERLGWDSEEKAIVIPIWGHSYEELITLRFRNVANPHMGRYWGIEGRNRVYGYGRRWIQGQRFAIIVFGEMTALFVHQWGFNSFSWTNGCMAFKPYLKGLLAHLDGGIIVPDVGEEDQARYVANLLGDGWQLAFLDSVWDGKGDVIDWVKDGGTRAKFCDLIINKTIKAGELRCYFAEKLGEIKWQR